jgi:hypothetical protein
VTWFGRLTLSLSLFVLEACGSGSGGTVKVKPDDPRFYDYTTASVGSLAELEQLAAVAATPEDRPAVAGASGPLRLGDRLRGRAQGKRQ